MSTYHGVRRTVVLSPDVGADAGFALASTGDKAFWQPGQPVDIFRWGIIADGLVDVGVGLTVKLDVRPKVGTDTDRGDGDGGDITITADLAEGDGIYTEECTSAAVTADSPGILELDPGEEIVFQVTDAADTAGTGYFFIEFYERPFVGDSNVTAGDAANRIAGFTSND